MPSGIVGRILEEMPFREEIIKWCEKQPNFLEALKIANPNRFTHFTGITKSSSPLKQGDEVLGVVVYDRREEILKQDFIVDLESKHKAFVYYTVLPKKVQHLYLSKYVRHLNRFCDLYSRGDYYLRTHHPELGNLDIEIQNRIRFFLNQNRLNFKDPKTVGSNLC